MSLFRHSAVGLGVSLERMTAAVYARDGGQWRIQSASLQEGAANTSILHEQVAHALDSLLAQSNDSHVHVVLTPESLREWVMDVPAGVQSLSELRRLTIARFTQLYGLSPDAWTVIADWKTHGPMLCTAAPTALVETLRAELERRGLRHSISTTLSSALVDVPALPEEAWVCIRTPGCIALLLIRRRTLHLLRTLRTVGADRSQQLTSVIAEMKRACLRAGFTPPQRLHWYDCSQQQMSQTVADGVEIVPLSSPALRRMASAPKDADSTVAACLGATL